MAPSLLARLGVPAEHRGTVRRHAVAWTLLGLFAGGTVQQLGFIVRTTGGSPLLVAFVTAGPHATALLSLGYSSLFERRSARAIVAASRLAFGALFLLTPVLPAPTGLALVGFAAVVAAKFGDTFYGRLFGGMYPPDLRGRLQSVPLFAQAMALAAASILAGRLLASHDQAYRWLLPLLTPAALVAAALILGFPVPAHAPREDRAPPRPRFDAAVREVVRDRAFLAWTVVYSVPNLGFWMVYASLPVYFASLLRFDYWQNGIATGAYNAAYCLGFLLWGRVLDRVRGVRTMVASWCPAALGTVLTAAGGSWPAAIAGQVVFGFALAGNDTGWYPVVLEFAPAHRVDRYMGVYMTAVGLRALGGGALGVALMGGGAGGSRTALVVAAALMAAGGAGMLAFGRRHRNGR